MDKEIKDSWLFIAEKMYNLSELDDILIDESRKIHMAVLNLKVISAHLKNSGVASGIEPVCDLIDRISKDLKEYSSILKCQRLNAQKAIKIVDAHFDIPKKIIEERKDLKIIE